MHWSITGSTSHRMRRPEAFLGRLWRCVLHCLVLVVVGGGNNETRTGADRRKEEK